MEISKMGNRWQDVFFTIYTGWWCNHHLEKYEVDGKDYPISEMENKTCLKPPTSILYIYIHIYIYNSIIVNYSFCSNNFDP